MSKKEELRVLCENMKKLRLHYGISKKKMAEICEISVHTLNRIEQYDFPEYVDYMLLANLSIHFRYSSDTLLNKNI